MAEQATDSPPPDELLLGEGQREVMHEVLTEGVYVNPLEVWAQAAAKAPDLSNLGREAEAATKWWVKPLWARLGLGLPGLLLLICQLWFEDWDRQFNLGLHDYLPWLRLFALLGGGVLLLAASPAPRPHYDQAPLKTRR